MTQIIKTALILIISTTLSFANNGEPKAKAVTSSEIGWKGYKIGGSHEGSIQLQSGELVYDESSNLTGGSFVLDMTSISCSDLEGEYKGKLEGHLKSDDFFGTTGNPTATLEITKVTSRGVDGEYKVIADLTIKGITNPIKFNVTTADNTHTADLSIDRSEYNVTYGSGSFFEKLGDNTIYDEFDISLSISAK